MKYFIEKAVHWLFRRKSPALYVLKAGISLVTLAFIGWAITISIPSHNGVYQLTLNSEGNIPIVITYLLFWLGVILICIGTIWEIIRFRNEYKITLRKRVIVIEARGLRDTRGTPFIQAIPPSFQGRRENLLLDLRQRVVDGVIIDPEAAINKLMSVTHQIELLQGGLDRSDITTIYGGMTPVPYTFLTGVILDDEGVINIYDWDRSEEIWRPLDDIDDNKRFTINGLECFPINEVHEVSLAISVSYQVDLNSIYHQYNDFPLVHLELEDGTPDSHWSETKQRELGKQFLNILIKLGNRGINRIHLFIAAPNSLVFRFGRLYDKRNLPEVIVYQYQRGETPAHPWGILMPVSGVTYPRIV